MEIIKDKDQDNITPEFKGDNHKGNDKLERLLQQRKYPNWTDMLAIIGIFLGSSLIAGLLVMLLRLFGVMTEEAANALAYLFTFALTIPAVIYLQRSRGQKKNFIKINVKGVDFPLMLWAILLVFVTSVTIEPLLELFPTKYLDFLNQNIGRGGWAILTVVVFAAVFEEILFRGLILESIKEKKGVWPAILISSLIFGVIHIIPQQAINAFFMGIILGYVYVKTGSLLTVMIIHAINNGIAYVMMELLGDQSTEATFRSVINNDTIYYIVYAISLILFAVGVIGIRKALKKTDVNTTN